MSRILRGDSTSSADSNVLDQDQDGMEFQAAPLEENMSRVDPATAEGNAPEGSERAQDNRIHSVPIPTWLMEQRPWLKGLIDECRSTLSGMPAQLNSIPCHFPASPSEHHDRYKKMMKILSDALQIRIIVVATLACTPAWLQDILDLIQSTAFEVIEQFLNDNESLEAHPCETWKYLDPIFIFLNEMRPIGRSYHGTLHRLRKLAMRVPDYYLQNLLGELMKAARMPQFQRCEHIPVSDSDTSSSGEDSGFNNSPFVMNIAICQDSPETPEATDTIPSRKVPTTPGNSLAGASGNVLAPFEKTIPPQGCPFDPSTIPPPDKPPFVIPTKEEIIQRYDPDGSIGLRNLSPTMDPYNPSEYLFYLYYPECLNNLEDICYPWSSSSSEAPDPSNCPGPSKCPRPSDAPGSSTASDFSDAPGPSKIPRSSDSPDPWQDSDPSDGATTSDAPPREKIELSELLDPDRAEQLLFGESEQAIPLDKFFHPDVCEALDIACGMSDTSEMPPSLAELIRVLNPGERFTNMTFVDRFNPGLFIKHMYRPDIVRKHFGFVSRKQSAPQSTSRKRSTVFTPRAEAKAPPPDSSSSSSSTATLSRRLSSLGQSTSLSRSSSLSGSYPISTSVSDPFGTPDPPVSPGGANPPVRRRRATFPSTTRFIIYERCRKCNSK